VSNVVFQLVMSRVCCVCVACLSEDTNELKNEVNEYTARDHTLRENENTHKTNKQHRREKERKSFLGCVWPPLVLTFFSPK
jgi:hypothetical protein